LTSRWASKESRMDSEPSPSDQIIKRLNEGVTRKLTLVSAPAGFGKTTLLSEWASHFGLATEARRKDPKTTPGLTPLQIRRVCGGVL